MLSGQASGQECLERAVFSRTTVPLFQDAGEQGRNQLPFTEKLHPLACHVTSPSGDERVSRSGGPHQGRDRICC